MSRAPAAAREAGMILLNVLLFVAVASAVVMLMISAEDDSLHRAARLAEASRARAAALGGELSAIVALRRDALVAPEADHAREPWRAIAQRAVPIRGGSFDLAIGDAEDRFNINLLARDDPAAATVAARIADALRLPPALVAGATHYVRVSGPVTDLAPLAAAGLPPATLARLRGLVTALPGPTTINLNSAGEDLIGILIGDPVAAHALVALRARQGSLVPGDLLLRHLALPPLAAFTSTTFRVQTTVRIGDTTQRLTSLLRRRAGAGGVAAIERRWNARPV